MRSLIAAIRSLLSRARFEREMREELAQHVQHRADDLIASGLSRESAERQARLEFGAVERYKEECTREIGVRMSLGATAGQVRAMVLKDGYKPVLQGLTIALFIGVAGRAIVSAMVVGLIDVVDAWMLIAVPVPLLLTAFFACWLPARRASRVDPNVALRHL